MTTVREQIERGITSQEIRDSLRHYWNKNKGFVPLCCTEAKLCDGAWFTKCSWLNEWLSSEEFEKKCLKCQEEIAEKI